MELVFCFAFAISMFVLVILGIVGLVTAPTPILLGILVTGILITQKSMNQFTEPKIDVMDEREKNRVEKVEVAPQTNISQKQIAMTSMVYRGKNYQPTVSEHKIKHKKPTVTIQYRGAKTSSSNKSV